MEHPNFPEPIEVGCECAEQLTEDYANPQSRERDLKNRSSRRSKFPELKRWKMSPKGNLWINYEDHHIIVIRAPKGECMLRIDDKPGRIKYKNVKEAQLKAFDVVQQMKKKHA